MIVLPRFFYIAFGAFKIGSYDILLILKSTVGSIMATLPTVILFALITEYLFHKFSDKKYIFLIYTVSVFILIYKFVPPTYFDYINYNNGIFNFISIIYFSIVAITVYVVYIFPQSLQQSAGTHKVE